MLCRPHLSFLTFNYSAGLWWTITTGTPQAIPARDLSCPTADIALLAKVNLIAVGTRTPADFVGHLDNAANTSASAGPV